MFGFGRDLAALRKVGDRRRLVIGGSDCLGQHQPPKRINSKYSRFVIMVRATAATRWNAASMCVIT